MVKKFGRYCLNQVIKVSSVMGQIGFVSVYVSAAGNKLTDTVFLPGARDLCSQMSVRWRGNVVKTVS